MSSFAIKLKAAMEGANMKAIDLHNATGISKATISEYLAGSYEPKQRNILKLARALHVQPSELMGMESDSTSTVPSNCSTPTPPDAIPLDNYLYKIPLLGRVAAGEPIYADEHIENYEYIDTKYKHDGQRYFALRIDGRSMEPTIMDGDIVIVRQQSTVDSGQIAIVLIDGEDATAKEVRESPEGITLVGHNVAVYTPHFYSYQQVEELPIQIIGIVVEIRRKLTV